MDLSSATTVVGHSIPRLLPDTKTFAKKFSARSEKCSTQESSAWLTATRPNWLAEVPKSIEKSNRPRQRKLCPSGRPKATNCVL